MRLLLAGLLVACSAHPLVTRIAGTRVGSYDMFTEVRSYRVSLDIDGVPLTYQQLAPWLGPDARRVLLGEQWKAGEANASLIPGAARDLAALGCRLSPHGRRAQLRIEYARPARSRQWTFRCEQP